MIKNLILVNVILAISYLMYWCLLRRSTRYQFKRFYMLSVMFLALIIPWLQFEGPIEVPVQTASFVSNNIAENLNVSQEVFYDSISQESRETPLLLLIYLSISILFLIRFMLNLIKLVRKTVKFILPIKVNGLNVVMLQGKGQLFSFFNFVFSSSDRFSSLYNSNAISLHERAHSRQLHSLDIIFSELIICIMWFNPFAWLFRKAIADNHEYLADQAVLDEGVSKEEYMQVMVDHQISTNSPLASAFSYLQTKKRIKMLNRKSKRSLEYFRIGVIVCMSVAVFSCSTVKIEHKPIVVVIDAGHGGKDPGCNVDEINEKDIVLNISNMLAAYSHKDNIEIRVTRHEDQFQELHSRLDYIKKIEPDMFISLHVNHASNPEVSGAEAYYYSGPSEERSMRLAESLLSELSDHTQDSKLAPARFYLLKNTNCPGTILELGFLSNSGDREFLNQSENQALVAQSIFEGIRKFRDQSLYGY
ncbi:MAG: N-acetylmuramoyl-L-alanine amidase [Flavobacteriales bacterium]|nr:N-acetylmuramoyl-L-alanine amidase [Flavobacteriales bacterium]